MPGFLARLFSGQRKTVDTVVEVKRVEDIPPIIEANRILLNQDYRRAISLLFKAMRADYSRFYISGIKESVQNRQFLIESYREFGMDLDRRAYTDNFYLVDAVAAPPPINEDKINQYNALRKLTYFYLDYYEPANYSISPVPNPETIMERATEFYSFLNIVKLYFEDKR